jgi:hypothetical protein
MDYGCTTPCPVQGRERGTTDTPLLLLGAIVVDSAGRPARAQKPTPFGPLSVHSSAALT